jgi:hypothetical protein
LIRKTSDANEKEALVWQKHKDQSIYSHHRLIITNFVLSIEMKNKMFAETRSTYFALQKDNCPAPVLEKARVIFYHHFGLDR